MAPNVVPVSAYDAATGQLVGRFDSVRSASTAYSISYALMHQLLNTGKAHRGTLFKRTEQSDTAAAPTAAPWWYTPLAPLASATAPKAPADSDGETSQAAETLAGWRAGNTVGNTAGNTVGNTAGTTATAALLAYQGHVIRERDAIIRQQQQLIEQQNYIISLAVSALPAGTV